MNILITGATGFIGKNIIDQLILEHNLFVIVKESSELHFRESIKTFLFEENIPELSLWIKEHNIEGVVHLASLFIAQHKAEDIKPLIDSNLYFGTAY
jgi:nucleoside-diphosphate-sugar epimerase